MNEDKPRPRPPDEAEVPLDQVRHPETTYDRSDLSAQGVLTFLIGLAITIILIHIITWGFLRYFAQNRLTAVPRSTAIVQPPTQMGPRGAPTLNFPAPQLQPDPVADLNKYRAAAEQQLNSYGWVDQRNGIVHIPIARAIDVVSQVGLPTHPQPSLPPHATFGTGDNTPAGAGGGTEPKGNK